MFNVDATRATSSTWKRKNEPPEPGDYVQIYTEHNESADGIVQVCTQLPRAKLFQLIPALEKYVHPSTGDIVLLGVASTVNTAILSKTIHSILGQAGQRTIFKVDVDGHPIAYIQTHVILVLLDLEKEARALEDRFWDLLRHVELKIDVVSSIWETFGTKAYAFGARGPSWPEGPYIPPYSRLYIEAMAWQVLNMKQEGKLDDWVEDYIFGKSPNSQPELQQVLEKRKLKYGLGHGFQMPESPQEQNGSNAFASLGLSSEFQTEANPDGPVYLAKTYLEKVGWHGRDPRQKTELSLSAQAKFAADVKPVQVHQSPPSTPKTQLNFNRSGLGLDQKADTWANYKSASFHVASDADISPTPSPPNHRESGSNIQTTPAEPNAFSRSSMLGNTKPNVTATPPNLTPTSSSSTGFNSFGSKPVGGESELPALGWTVANANDGFGDNPQSGFGNTSSSMPVSFGFGTPIPFQQNSFHNGSTAQTSNFFGTAAPVPNTASVNASTIPSLTTPAWGFGTTPSAAGIGDMGQNKPESTGFSPTPPNHNAPVFNSSPFLNSNSPPPPFGSGAAPAHSTLSFTSSKIQKPNNHPASFTVAEITPFGGTNVHNQPANAFNTDSNSMGDIISPNTGVGEGNNPFTFQSGGIGASNPFAFQPGGGTTGTPAVRRLAKPKGRLNRR